MSPDDVLSALEPLRSGADVRDPAPGRVLIVDDDVATRLTLAAMLSPVGHRIIFASSAAEVRQRLPLINPDVIVCDLVMEDMCGDEFFRWLKAHARWHVVPIVAITQLNNPLVRADLLDAGADCVLCKPCDAHEFRAQVRAALRIRRKLDELFPAVRHE
ncbi:MAG TPA: response regulator [Steroidobacteraceae bacterium]